MTLWNRLWSWLRAILWRTRVESEMDAELRFHVEACAEDLARSGVRREEALRRRQRTHEIGIRMALGAEKPQVLRMILWQGLRMTAIGAAIGLLMALPLPKAFEAMFYDLHIHEPGLYLIVPTAMALVAMLATYIPARRAMRVDPIVALRYE